MVRLSDLQLKEVISVVDGRRFGFIVDLEIDVKNGRVLSLILMNQDQKTGLFSKGEETFIPWNNILRIGTDVILVKNATNQNTLLLPTN